MFDSLAKSSESHGFGVCSPQLWRESKEKSHGKNYRCLSPASKAEAVARGERELMEMVNKMPESCYELTLRDLVEVNQDIQNQMFDSHTEKINSETKQIRIKKKDDRAQESRNSGIKNEGFLLKMAFPINFGSKNTKKKNKKKKIDSCSSSYSERRSNSSKIGYARDKEMRTALVACPLFGLDIFEMQL